MIFEAREAVQFDYGLPARLLAYPIEKLPHYGHHVNVTPTERALSNVVELHQDKIVYLSSRRSGKRIKRS